VGKSKKNAKIQNPERVYIPNKRAYHDFAIGEKFEAGIVLRGFEVKSIRKGQASLVDSFVRVRESEATLINAYIAPYEQADIRNYDPRQSRKLLLHRKELMAILGRTSGTNLTVVPTALYIKHGFIKVELALARGKKQFEKKEDIKRRDMNRDVQQQLRGKL